MTTAAINAEIHRILEGPDHSNWLKFALHSALARDPLDAYEDSEALAELLARRAYALLQEHPTEIERELHSHIRNAEANGEHDDCA